MIQANELRIGNCILLDTGFVLPAPHVIKGQDIADIENGRITLTAIQPIPLTPEILEKCSAKEGDQYVFYKANIYLYQYPGHNHWLVKAAGNIKLTSVQFVHQFQNLYHSLTGEELPINL